MTTTEKLVFKGFDDVAAAAANELASNILELLDSKGSAEIVLTGGSVGIRTLEILAPLIKERKLAGLRFWFGDERFVSRSSSDRNDLQADNALLSHLNLDAESIMRFPSTEDGTAVDGASGFGKRFIEINPQFDIVLLGMGPDGHVASLFPGSERVKINDSVEFEPNSPKPPAQRLTLSYRALNNSRQVWFLVSGKEKANALSDVFSGSSSLPAAKVVGLDGTKWFVDKESVLAISS
jgi:6-phosphogluconolactonase